MYAGMLRNFVFFAINAMRMKNVRHGSFNCYLLIVKRIVQIDKILLRY